MILANKRCALFSRTSTHRSGSSTNEYTRKAGTRFETIRNVVNEAIGVARASQRLSVSSRSHMQKLGDFMLLSASDLVGHLNCRHLTGLDIAVATGALEKPKVWDPLLQVLWERGARHEEGFVEHLKSQGLSVTVIDGTGVDDEAVTRTRDAMIAGDKVIVQGAFRANGWTGRTDILKRIETASDLGAWSYEVIDTKLARETKGGTVLQLCLYADLVATV